MTRIIHFRNAAPLDNEGVYVTTDLHFNTTDFFGEQTEIVSDETYPIVLDAEFPTDVELINEG